MNMPDHFDWFSALVGGGITPILLKAIVLFWTEKFIPFLRSQIGGLDGYAGETGPPGPPGPPGPMGPPGKNAFVFYRSAAAPSFPKAGDFWFNPGSGKVFRRNELNDKWEDINE